MLKNAERHQRAKLLRLRQNKFHRLQPVRQLPTIPVVQDLAERRANQHVRHGRRSRSGRRRSLGKKSHFVASGSIIVRREFGQGILRREFHGSIRIIQRDF